MSKSVIEPAGRRIISQRRLEGHPFRRSSRDFELLKTEQARLESFSLEPPWSLGFITPEKLAQAGFFYLQDGDKVQCAFCRGIAGEWEQGDNPATEHRKHFPKCPFVCNLPVGNVPLQEESYHETSSSGGSDVCGPYLDFATSLSIQFSSRASHQWPDSGQKAVSDQEIRDLIDTPVVQGALDMGIELCKVKTALQRKIQQTGTPFPSTGALLDAVLRTRDPEYESDPDSDRDDEEFSPPLRRPCHFPFNFNSLTLNTNNSPQFGSGDEDVAGSGSQSPSTPQQSLSSPSGDSGMSRNSGGSGDEDMETGSLGKNPSSSSPGTENSPSKIGIEGKEEELRQLREVTQCKICMDSKVQVVFLPCGHLVSCTRCATALSNCAVCREPIKAYVKTYLS